MNNKIKNILEKLEGKGYKAYVVGGFVRDFLLNKQSFDVDISTDAHPKEIIDIFDLKETSNDNYGRIYFKDSLYNYDITTFRKEISYENRKPIDFDYTSDIDDDINRRDFTINAIYMDSKGNIFDPLNGLEDLNKKTIRFIGNIDTRMMEDPLRILRAIRFASSLDFKMDDKLYNFINLNKDLINTLSISRKKEELDRIFSSQNKLLGLKLIKDLNMESVLDITIPDNISYTDSYLGIWAQLNPSNYNFTKSEKKTINDINKIIKYGIIDNIILYECGLFPSIIAGEILNTNSAYISNLYASLPIYSRKDINITGNEIIEILDIKPGRQIESILSDIEISILNNMLENNNKVLREYIIDNWK